MSRKQEFNEQPSPQACSALERMRKRRRLGSTQHEHNVANERIQPRREQEELEVRSKFVYGGCSLPPRITTRQYKQLLEHRTQRASEAAEKAGENYRYRPAASTFKCRWRTLSPKECDQKAERLTKVVEEVLRDKVRLLAVHRRSVQHTMDSISQMLKDFPELRPQTGLRCVIDNQGFTVTLNNQMPIGCRPGIEYY